MEISFQLTRDREFTIEVGYFDTILEIKEKVEKDQGIPRNKQTLVFNGKVLQDETNVLATDLLDRSQIQIIVAPDSSSEKNSIKHEESLSFTAKIRLHFKIPTSKSGVVTIELDKNDTIRKIKEKIHEMEGLPINRIILQANSVELNDQKTIHDSGLVDRSEIEVSIRPSSTAGSPGSAGNMIGSKKLRIIVLTKCGTKKIPLEVNPTDTVAELRKELQKLNQDLQLELPPEGYFFIYKQNVMDDDRSFRWHHVSQGDIIEIFNGSVTGGS